MFNSEILIKALVSEYTLYDLELGFSLKEKLKNCKQETTLITVHTPKSLMRAYKIQIN
jgi:hypothetical protein